MHFPVTHNLQCYTQNNVVTFFVLSTKYANIKSGIRLNAFFF